MERLVGPVHPYPLDHPWPGKRSAAPLTGPGVLLSVKAPIPQRSDSGAVPTPAHRDVHGRVLVLRHPHARERLSGRRAERLDVGLTAFFSVAYRATLCTDVAAIEATTVELNQTTGKQLTGLTDPRTDVGTNAGECLPFQCAPVVSLRTATLSRAGRGRFYAPSLAVDQVAAGRMVTGAQTALANSALALLRRSRPPGRPRSSTTGRWAPQLRHEPGRRRRHRHAAAPPQQADRGAYFPPALGSIRP